MRAARLIAIAALAAAVLQCGDDRDVRPSPAPRPPDDAARIDVAIRHATRYLADPRHQYEHAAFYFLHFLHRRFGIADFADVPDRYRAFRSLDPSPATGVDVFERLIEPNAQLPRDRLAAIPHPVDRFTVAALYCDEAPVPDGYEALLREMMAKGGYELTHVALAIAWLGENGCTPRVPALRADVVAAMAAGVHSDERVDDVELESAALLHYLGRGDLVPADFPVSILRAQHGDGGWAVEWPQTGGPGSHWHPTVMALWVLLESQGLGNGAPMIPPRPAGAALQ